MAAALGVLAVCTRPAVSPGRPSDARPYCSRQRFQLGPDAPLRAAPREGHERDEERIAPDAQKEYRLAHGERNEKDLVLPKRDATPMWFSSLKSMWWTCVARQKVEPHLPISGLRDSCG